MLARAALRRRKLSTRRLRRDAAVHNRAMAPLAPPPDSSALGRFLTLADTAELLNISAGQAYARGRSGNFPASRSAAAVRALAASGAWSATCSKTTSPASTKRTADATC